jgi:pSer/pThr/pTyr-binding forkhead associated (FHA) protein
MPARPGTGFLHESKAVRLEIVRTSQVLSVPTQGHITLGRADSAEGWQPTIDLTPYGARELGVSRIHADLYFENDQAFVLEMGSSNGTLLNGVRCVIGEAQRLHNGDTIELGGLALRVFFN